MRICIQDTTRRSNQMLNRVSTTRIAKAATALITTRMNHHGMWVSKLPSSQLVMLSGN